MLLSNKPDVGWYHFEYEVCTGGVKFAENPAKFAVECEIKEQRTILNYTKIMKKRDWEGKFVKNESNICRRGVFSETNHNGWYIIIQYCDISFLFVLSVCEVKM